MVSRSDLIPQVIANLDSWLDTMRLEGGYGGPVSHWWQNCLQYTGPGLDWRYEGIITGYLNLYKKTDNKTWLEKAKMAGHDLVNGQLTHGNFRNSSFEMNPKGGGTPHEAAADVGLLRLAETLKEDGGTDYKVFLETARRNIEEYYIKRLWDSSLKMFRDSTLHPSFVPNKSATLVEALLLLAKLTESFDLVENHAIPTVDLIIKHQENDKKNKCSGGIYQMSISSRDGLQVVSKAFPFYTARCIPALIQAYDYTEGKKYLNCAKDAVNFLINSQYKDGSFPQVVYKNKKVARNPQWIAGIGDILRAFHLTSDYGVKTDFEGYLRRLLLGQDACGGIRTAVGFAVQTSPEEYDGLPDFRDLLHVVGWCDKSFRFLTSILPENAEIPEATLEKFSSECVFLGREGLFSEDEKSVVFRDSSGRSAYTWRKGETIAELDVGAWK